MNDDGPDIRHLIEPTSKMGPLFGVTDKDIMRAERKLSEAMSRPLDEPEDPLERMKYGLQPLAPGTSYHRVVDPSVRENARGPVEAPGQRTVLIQDPPPSTPPGSVPVYTAPQNAPRNSGRRAEKNSALAYRRSVVRWVCVTVILVTLFISQTIYALLGK